MAAGIAAGIDGFQRPVTVLGAPLEEGRAVRLAQQADRDVPPRVDVVHEQEHLAETGMSQVVDEQFRVTLSQVVPPRRGDGSSSPHQVPESAYEPVGRRLPVERRADQPPPEATPSAPAPVRSGLGLERVDQEKRQQRRDAGDHDSRDVAGEAGRIELRREQPSVRSGHGGACVDAQKPEQIARGINDGRSHQRQQRERQGGENGREQPSGDPEGPAPPVQFSYPRPAPAAAVIPEPGAAVHGREEGADDADAPAGYQVYLHARFGQRAEHAGVVRAGRAGARQYERRSQLRNVAVRRLGNWHSRASHFVDGG